MANTQDTLAEILKWSEGRPAWQRDALRRIFVKGIISESDLADFVRLCKLQHGLDKGGTPSEPLLAEHLPIKGASFDPVSLESLTHHQGANALASNQTIAFGPHLTIVFGQNASGKSGYTRILKQACRTRAREDVLGNVLAGSTPLALRASIRFREGTITKPEWKSGDPASTALASVSIFDSNCAPIYLEEKTDVAFRPFALDVFDELSVLCAKVKAELQRQQSAIAAPLQGLPTPPEGTRARDLVNGLTAFTDSGEVSRLVTLSEVESKRLKELRQLRSDLQAANPEQLAKELNLKAARIESIADHCDRIADVYGEDGIKKIQRGIQNVRAARKALEAVRKAALGAADLLPGTGQTKWRKMWESAVEFGAVAYSDREPLILREGDKCPFCQQILDSDADRRMGHFAEYISSSAQSDVDTAERDLSNLLRTGEMVDIKRQDTEGVLQEVATEDKEVPQLTEEFLRNAEGCRKELKVQTEGGELVSTRLGMNPASRMRTVARGFRERAAVLGKKTPEMESGLAAELKELEARVDLAKATPILLAEIERQKRFKLYTEAMDDTATAAITKKSGDLTERLVTEELRGAFKKELGSLGFTNMDVELREAGAIKGTLYHHLVFANAPGVEMSQVLSEGESRTLSLAAFLAELSTSEAQSAIIFDDPVSSLDHVWRERIAKRLVTEAKGRQVIVFTHDVLFLQNLRSEADDQNVDAQYQHVGRGGQIGITSSELPWIAMPLKDRLAKLREMANKAENLYKAGSKEDYESTAQRSYGMLRDAWEQGVTQVLLNDVVERYRHSIETRKLAPLQDITQDDFDDVDAGMSECSRWMVGHYAPTADGTPYPGPDHLKQQIELLETWRKGIETRRQKKPKGAPVKIMQSEVKEEL